jgi:hypothetical protein
MPSLNRRLRAVAATLCRWSPNSSGCRVLGGHNDLDDMLGVEGLEDLVLQSATLTLADMQKTVLDGVAAWSHGPLADDVSLVIVEVR